MKSTTLFLLAISLSTIFTAACGSSGPANANALNTNSPNTNAPKANTNNPLAVTTPTPDQVTNNAPTLTPVYKAYCAAVVKKDEAAIRKFYTADTIKNFEEQMKAADVKTLGKFLEDDGITNEVCDVSNERIAGDKAVGKIRTKGYPNGFDVLFVKENGEWKMSTMDPKTAFPPTSANTAK
jgi:hypothetical protein